MFVARAGDNDAVAGKSAAVQRGLQRDGHLTPFVEGRGAAKFNAVFVDRNGFSGKFQFCISSRDIYRLPEGICTGQFFCAHKFIKLNQTNTSAKSVKLMV